MENSYSPVHLVIMAHTGTIWNGHVPKDVAELNEGEKKHGAPARIPARIPTWVL